LFENRPKNRLFYSEVGKNDACNQGAKQIGFEQNLANVVKIGSFDFIYAVHVFVMGSQIDAKVSQAEVGLP